MGVGHSRKGKKITGVTLRLSVAAVSCVPMSFNALVMCREQQSLRVLATAMDELRIEGRVCASAADTLDLMVREQCSAIVVDFDLPNAGMVARMARLVSAHRRPVVFAMIGALTEISRTFQAGANFVLYKPLVREQILRSLRAGRGFMKPDRRSAPRQKMESLAYLQFSGSALPAMVLDLNGDGLALQAPEPLPPVQEVPLRFVLPGTTHLVEAVGEVIWVDDVGRAGIFFTRLKPASQKHLKNWLAKRDRNKKVLAHTTPNTRKRAVSLPAL